MSLKVFALIITMMPLFSLPMNAWISHLPVFTYTRLHWVATSRAGLAEFYLLYPLAGLCIYLMKSWSYPAYILVSVWTLALNVLVWRHNYNSSVGVLLSSTAFIVLSWAYYLHPKVRRVFFDHSIKWWETSPRYLANLMATINGDIRKECELVNISEGGALIKTDWSASDDERVSLDFDMQNLHLKLDAEVVHLRDGYFGVRFSQADKSGTSEQGQNLRRFKQALRLSEMPLYNKPDAATEQLSTWFKDLRHGKGIIPTV